MNIFLDIFSDRQEVFSNFSQSSYHRDRTQTSSLGSSDLDAQFERSNILVASYSYEDYSGWAFVLFEDTLDGKIYEVNGSHCSCYGLEGQWSPEEVHLESLLHRVTQGRIINAETSLHIAEVVKKRIEEREEAKNLEITF